MESPSKKARDQWLRRREGGDPSKIKRDEWMHAKQHNERVHIHFECTCLACGQVFAICGLPCFVICPNCHLTLKLQSG